MGYQKTEDGKYRITAIEGELNSLGTVEAVKSYLGIHEYRGHGIKGYPGGKTVGHQKAYRDQYNHWTYKYLSPIQQKEIKERMNGIW